MPPVILKTNSLLLSVCTCYISVPGTATPAYSVTAYRHLRKFPAAVTQPILLFIFQDSQPDVWAEPVGRFGMSEKHCLLTSPPSTQLNPLFLSTYSKSPQFTNRLSSPKIVMITIVIEIERSLPGVHCALPSEQGRKSEGHVSSEPLEENTAGFKSIALDYASSLGKILNKNNFWERKIEPT